MSVELAALHAATKNIINLTARTGGLYAGGVLSRSPPHTADVAFRVAPRQSVDGQRPLRAVGVWRSYCESPVVVVVDEKRFYAACDNCLKGS